MRAVAADLSWRFPTSRARSTHSCSASCGACPNDSAKSSRSASWPTWTAATAAGALGLADRTVGAHLSRGLARFASPCAARTTRRHPDDRQPSAYRRRAAPRASGASTSHYHFQRPVARGPRRTRAHGVLAEDCQRWLPPPRPVPCWQLPSWGSCGRVAPTTPSPRAAVIAQLADARSRRWCRLRRRCRSRSPTLACRLLEGERPVRVARHGVTAENIGHDSPPYRCSLRTSASTRPSSSSPTSSLPRHLHPRARHRRQEHPSLGPRGAGFDRRRVRRRRHLARRDGRAGPTGPGR